MRNEDKKELLFTDARGVYIPRDFAIMYESEESLWTGCSDEDINILLKGPDEEHYWEAWEVVSMSAFATLDSQYWYLHQDGDLFAVRHDYNWEEEDE